MLATCFSGLMCSWLLVSFCRLQGQDRWKLVGRQLWHIAAADLWFAVFTAPYFMFALLLRADVKIVQDDLVGMATCGILGILYSGGIKTSIMLECHMALYFLSAVHHWQRLLLVLSRSLYVVWTFGFAFSLMEVLTGDVSYYLHTDHGFECAPSSQRGVFFICITAVSFCCCIACHMMCWLKVGVTGEALQAQVWCRAQLYPLVAIASYGPELLACLGGVRRSWPMVLLSQTLLCLNGALNTGAYVLQTRSPLNVESRYESLADLLLPGDVRYRVPVSSALWSPRHSCPDPPPRAHVQIESVRC